MCCCSLTFTCQHKEAEFKPYHCQCDNHALANKTFARSCEACEQAGKETDEDDYQKRVVSNDQYFARVIEIEVELRMDVAPAPAPPLSAAALAGYAELEASGEV